MGMKCAGVYRVRNEGMWIGESLERTLQVCERAIVFDDHSDDDTVEIARGFGDRVHVFSSGFADADEARDRGFVLNCAVQICKPDWVLYMDGDEVLTPSAVREVREVVQMKIGGIFVFRIAYLWNSPDQERVDALYGKINAPRLFSVFDQKGPFTYKTTSHTANLHCGQVPANYKGHARHAISLIKHYGYMRPEDRERKYKWYVDLDVAQRGSVTGNYEHIMERPNHWCPGPPEFRPFADV